MESLDRNPFLDRLPLPNREWRRANRDYVRACGGVLSSFDRGMWAVERGVITKDEYELLREVGDLVAISELLR